MSVVSFSRRFLENSEGKSIAVSVFEEVKMRFISEGENSINQSQNFVFPGNSTIFSVSMQQHQQVNNKEYFQSLTAQNFPLVNTFTSVALTALLLSERCTMFTPIFWRSQHRSCS
jgi:hypothetical protein